MRAIIVLVYCSSSAEIISTRHNTSTLDGCHRSVERVIYLPQQHSSRPLASQPTNIVWQLAARHDTICLSIEYLHFYIAVTGNNNVRITPAGPPPPPPPRLGEPTTVTYSKSQQHAEHLLLLFLQNVQHWHANGFGMEHVFGGGWQVQRASIAHQIAVNVGAVKDESASTIADRAALAFLAAIGSTTACPCTTSLRARLARPCRSWASARGGRGSASQFW